MMNGGNERGPSQSVERIHVPKPYEREGSPEMERAKRYWRERLTGEQRIKEPQHPACKLGIVVPVFNEDVRRLAQQLDSLRAQKDIHPDQFEVLYVVNNDRDDGSVRALDIRAKNLHTATYLQQNQGMYVHVIDKSSPGNTIANCNVGRARNRGVAEAGVRFYEQEKNGILLQTDADTWFEDPHHLAKVCQAFEEDEEIIGLAGGLIFEWDPDAAQTERRADLQQKLKRFFRLRQYTDLRDFLLKPGVVRYAQGTRFSGAHVITRSLELAMVGGIDDTPKSGSSNFGLRLEGFAQQHGQKVLGKRTELRLVTALRESDRTGSSFKRLFDEIDRDADKAVRDVTPDEELPTFRFRFYGEFKAAFEREDMDAVRQLITLKSGRLLIDEARFLELTDHVRTGRIKRFRELLAECNKAYTGKKTLLETLYEDASVPTVELTDEYIEKVRGMVAARPDGPDFLQRMDAYYEAIQIKEAHRVE